VTDFEERGLPFKKDDEYASANYYSNVLDAGKEGKIFAEMSAGGWVYPVILSEALSNFSLPSRTPPFLLRLKNRCFSACGHPGEPGERAFERDKHSYAPCK